MPSWDRRFIQLARFVSEWSKDPKAHVGAVVTNERDGAVALGYNGFPRGVEDRADRLKNQDLKLEMIVHAEQNALRIAGSRAHGGTIYVWGKPICARCAGLIIQGGIIRVVAISPTAGDSKSKWFETGKIAIEMLREANIRINFIDESRLSGK